MTYQTIDVEPQPNGFGAAIKGADLAGGLSDQEIKEIRDAWLNHSVVYFPRQDLSLEQLEALTETIGPFDVTDFIKSVEGHPHVLELRREPDETATHFAGSWHSDVSYQPEPVSATILHSKVTPPIGGDTLFADGYRAYEALSDKMKEFLEGLQGIHSADLAYGKEGFYAQEGEGDRSIVIEPDERAKAQVLHPIIRTHPETGRKTIFSNIVYTIGIDGMTQDESRAIIDFLHRHTTQDKFVYRHVWQQDMVTIWDNRCVQHFAVAGFDGYRRVMWRTVVKGDKPR